MGDYWLEVHAHFARWMTHLKRQPMVVAFSLIQPFMWLFIFSQALERALASSGIEAMRDYAAFMTAAALVMTVFNNSLAGGMPVLFDREFGTLDRILVAPIARSSLVVGRFLAVGLVSALQVALVLGLAALILGVTPVTGWPGAAAILGLTLLFGFGVTAFSLTLAFVFRTHVEFLAVLAFVGLPLVFLSTALVPLEAMPAWLAVVAQLNPMSYCIDGVRALIQRGWEPALLTRMTLALAVFDAVMLALAVVVIRRRL